MLMNCHNSSKNKSGFTPVTVIIHKTDSLSGIGIPRAAFELTACNGAARTGATDANGVLAFCLVPCNNYSLRELSPPPGYQPLDRVFNICADACGDIFIDGVLTPQLVIENIPIFASFTAIKVNLIDGLPLAGATYGLFLNSLEIARTVSDAAGQVSFVNLAPGSYELVEITPPPGFQANAESLTVIVAPNGSVTIMDQPADGFILNDVPLMEFIFRKLDESTGLPLAGSAFELSQNGTVIATVISGSDGLVAFGVLAVGTYQLTETVTPPDFEPNSTVYQVIVGADGSITVNGIPLDAFVVENIRISISQPPVINNIFEGAIIITGTGVPGSTVIVTLPNGQTITSTVNSSGIWLTNLPVGVELVAGDIVAAIQIETGKLPSEAAATVVLALAIIEPLLEKSVENVTAPGGAAHPGDVLQFQILIGNVGDPGSVWTNAVLTDFISEDLTFIPNTVAIDGQLISAGTGVGQYLFDSVAAVLTVNVGDLAAQEIREVTFLVTVNLDASGSVIINNVTAGSMSIFGERLMQTASSSLPVIA